MEYYLNQKEEFLFSKCEHGPGLYLPKSKWIMNEAKLLLWGKVDVEEWNSHKCHQRLVKLFGQLGRPEMVLLEYSNFLDELIHKSGGTETIPNHVSKAEMRKLNWCVFEKLTWLLWWLYWDTRIRWDLDKHKAPANKRCVQGRPGCYSASVKGGIRWGGELAPSTDPVKASPKKQAALIRGKSKFGLRVSEDSIMWSWWEESMSRWHIVGTPYHFIWKGRRDRISWQDLMEWEKKLMAPKSIPSHMGANYKWVPGNVSSLGTGDTAPALVSLAGTVDTEEKFFKLRTL